MLSISNQNYFPNRNGYKAKYIIVHSTAGGTSAEAIARYFQTAQTSSHYVIGTDGQVVQCVGEEHGAWANGYLSSGHDSFWNESINPNLLTITIEHCKPTTDNSNDLTEPQKQASFRLISDVCQRNSIPRRWADEDGGITGHFSIDPINRSRCPGPYPWNELFEFLNDGDNMIPNGWTDDGTVLIAPNGIPVVLGFRGFILSNKWNPDNYPLEPEHGRDPVESYYKSDPGAIQTFNFCRLCYTQKRGVYVMGIGNELLGCEKDLQNTKLPEIKNDILNLARKFNLL